MQDRARIYVEGGRGGDGCVSFRREAHVPRGGPDGGDGGHGGDVVAVCDASRRDLGAARGGRHFRAGKGGAGQGSDRHGARGEDAVIAVAPGTEAVGLDGERFDLLRPGDRAVLARGGRGGRGNRRFASSTRQAPRFAERGDTGASGWVEMRLKLLADVGLVGLPNAGKSSLLAALTRASPKVADYPFTTLEPVLGTIDFSERQAVLADIPGLIAGAAEGAGLGHEFLAHVERCSLLLHVVELEPAEGEPESNYRTVREELAGHGAGLERLPELVVLSKADLVPEQEAERAAAGWAGGGDVLAVSAATGAGLEELRRRILAMLGEAEAGPPAADRTEAVAGAVADGDAAGSPAAEATEAEYRIYRPAGEEGYTVRREGEAFRIEGRGIELLFERHDLANEEALAYLEQRLTELGVVAALRARGFEPGDEIRVGEHELELHPG